MNSYYNNTINHYLETTDTDIDNLIKMVNNNTHLMLKIIDAYNNDMPTDAFKETEQDIQKIKEENLRKY